MGRSKEMESLKNKGPFDLHVLGTPPALILSQDQTLQKDFPFKGFERRQY